MRVPSVPPPYTGACLCGKVQYELTAWPITYYACHCTDCQRRSGAAMRLAMWVERVALAVKQGSPELRTFSFGEGRQRRAKVCVDCDTRLWAEPADKPKLAILLPGTLHNHREFEPVAHLWTRSALPWVSIPSDAKRYETGPADPMELVALWRQATPTGWSAQNAT